MKLLEILQGKWLGHPLHPAIVHVPIGLWTVACLLDVIVWFFPDWIVLARLSQYAVLVGVLAALLAVPTGAADWASVKPEKPAWKIALVHLLLNLVATVLWAVNFGLRLIQPEGAQPISLGVLLTSIGGTLFVFAGGYLGALLVFDHGIGVARFSKKKWRAIAERGGSRVPEDT